MVKVTMTDEDLAERGQNNYFDEGEHEVLIEKVERGTTQNGKDYIEFSVLGHNDERDTARLWLTTENASKYALSILAGIAVHNKQTDKEKDAVREAFKKITDTDEIDQAFLDKYKEMDAFFQVYQSTDRTYTDNSGVERFSYDKNIYGYMPNPPKVKQPTAEELVADMKNGEPFPVDEVPFP